MTKIGRNDPCSCGSGKKFKKCHGAVGASIDTETVREVFGAFGTNPLEQTIRQTPIKDIKSILSKVIAEKQSGRRSFPSSKLISIGDNLTTKDRYFLLDTCACLVDENWCGRAEMCIYFAVLVRHGLDRLGYHATVELGKARYTMGGKTFEWDHAWIKTESGDIIDGNVDSMVENPFVPNEIQPKPYWGPLSNLPKDRVFRKDRNLPPEQDEKELEATEIGKWKTELDKQIAHYKNF